MANDEAKQAIIKGLEERLVALECRAPVQVNQDITIVLNNFGKEDTSYISEYISDIQSIQNIEIRAKIKGYLEKIYVDEGKLVKKGQILFKISNQGYKEELIKARA